jgi:MarR family transcriptional regulator, multiple antibiotic resistance protein MarR
MIRKVSRTPRQIEPQPPGTDVAFTIGPLIGRVRSVLLTKLDGELQPFGLTGMQFAILKILSDRSAGTAADLSRSLHYDTGSMTRLLDRLQEKGLIRRERSKDDRRLVALRVTRAGRAVMPRLQGAAARAVQRMLTGFSAAEIGELRGFLDRMIDNGLPARKQ